MRRRRKRRSRTTKRIRASSIRKRRPPRLQPRPPPARSSSRVVVLFEENDMKILQTAIAIAAASALLAGCQSMQSSSGPKASAMLEPTKGSSVRGSVTFVEQGSKVRVIAAVSGLRPNGEYGFHVHEA